MKDRCWRPAQHRLFTAVLSWITDHEPWFLLVALPPLWLPGAVHRSRTLVSPGGPPSAVAPGSRARSGSTILRTAGSPGSVPLDSHPTLDRRPTTSPWHPHELAHPGDPADVSGWVRLLPVGLWVSPLPETSWVVFCRILLGFVVSSADRELGRTASPSSTAW